MIKEPMTNYLKSQLSPQTLDMQTYISILIIASPSIPIYFLIKVLKLQHRSWFNFFVQMGIAFSIGALTGDLFGHIVPETFEKVDHHDATAGYVIIGGVCFYYLLDKFFTNIADSKTIRSQTKNIIFLLADGLHNVTDGFAIASLYKLSKLKRLRKRYYLDCLDFPARGFPPTW